ncbi:NmrA-like family domain-containing protein-like protein [Emericellopsis cladophorae]|uniref:NmrA-like family domain-containing protein-like protein n=1 Tax=Emericellopsis cladophorae TaxID=2686198 RepID=A0A9Q0BE54_9HYPO|nr:NmrA-like family domain-containing protein-like protein [Emericellopsis cladophorae]KAI6782567.1 NmrA-like family domain-containing protein-like protein [Emericellopsis cladophorae]
MPTFFLNNITGLQGSATARYLLDQPSPPTIVALCRDPTSPKAQAFQKQGVTLIKGDWDNAAAIEEGVKGADAVFMNFMPDFNDWSANLRSTNTTIAHCKTHAVPHVVLSSGVYVDNLAALGVQPDSILGKILTTKADLEKAVKESGLNYTILRPANFMANYIDPFAQRQVLGLAETGVWKTALREDDKLPLVSTQTIGRVAARALQEPVSLGQKTLTYADETLTLKEMFAVLSSKAGRELRMESLSEEEVEATKGSNPFVAGQQAMRNMAQLVNVDKARERMADWGMEPVSFARYLDSEAEGVKATYGRQ